ncbi:MAG TPA: HD domain-containing protein [Acidimicrobiales bacterium]|nr:HD domain-containing protein [Acidimicrobiales bacterium]
MTDTAKRSASRSFTRMDESSAEEWGVIATESIANSGRVAERVLGLLESLAEITDGFAVDQLTHSLQTATRAEEAGADDELVVAALCHDIGKAVSVPNHPHIAAEVLKPYVRDEVYHVIDVHQDFQGRHYYAYFDMDPEAREQYRGEPWFELAERFADDWDQTSFDPDYPTQSLEHFAPLVREVFARAKSL